MAEGGFDQDPARNLWAYILGLIAAGVGGFFTWATRKKRHQGMTLEAHNAEVREWSVAIESELREIAEHSREQTEILRDIKDMMMDVWKKVG